jgi:hypothetical protein
MQLNRAMLARQLLLERSPISVTDAIEQIGGLQTQYAPSGYVGLWSRLSGFPRAALTRALEERQAVQATLIRSTIHTVTVPDYRLFTEGVRNSRRRWWLRVSRPQIEGLDMDEVAAFLRRILEEGPRTRAELTRLLVEAGFGSRAWPGAGLWLDMVRIPPSGTWERRRADLYGLADWWLPPARVTEAEGLRRLVYSYLQGFGPAPLKDLANWAGLPVAALRPAVDGLELRRFRDGNGVQLIDLPDGPLPDPETPAPVRFLPTWDATLLAHCRRTQILPEAYRALVFHTKTPHSFPTFTVGGQVAGKWRYENGEVVLEPFAPLAPAVRDQVDQEAALLAAFHT